MMNSLSKVVEGVAHRSAGGVFDADRGQRVVEIVAQRGFGDRAVVESAAPLEQQRHRRVVDAFVLVVGDHQRHVGPVVADAGDDGRQHVRQIRCDHQKPLRVGLGRGDLQQRDQLAGGRQPVLDEAVVRQLGQFLDPDSGVTQHLYHGPGPEPAVFFEAEVAAPTGVGVLGPDAPGGLGLQHRPAQRHPGGGEQLARAGPARRRRAARRCGRARPPPRRPAPAAPAAVRGCGWSIRDLRCDRSFLWETSLALTGQRTAHGPHRAGSSSAHSAMSR